MALPTETRRSRAGLTSEARLIPASEGMERETGIEPATNSLEGCDSTTELLPPSRRPLRPSARRQVSERTTYYRVRPSARLDLGLLANRSTPQRAKVGGEGRTRTFEGARPTYLQSAAFDRFA